MTKIIQELTNAKGEIDRLSGELSAIALEREAIKARPPHTDDIVAAFTRGLDTAARDFVTRLSWHLNDKSHRETAASFVEGSVNATLLLPQQMRPSWAYLMPQLEEGFPRSGADVSAMSYFLRPIIEPQIRPLVERLCPGAAEGMRQDDRDAALAELDDREGTVREKYDELKAFFDQASAAMAGAGGA